MNFIYITNKTPRTSPAARILTEQQDSIKTDGNT